MVLIIDCDRNWFNTNWDFHTALVGGCAGADVNTAIVAKGAFNMNFTWSSGGRNASIGACIVITCGLW